MATATIANWQIQRFNSLLNKLGVADSKQERVEEVSKGRATSTKDLTFNEAKELIDDLEAKLKAVDPCDRMRKKILAICHTMQWYIRDNGKLVLKDNEPQLNMDSINAFCVKYGMYHKELNEHTYEELQKLIYVFRQVAKTELKK